MTLALDSIFNFLLLTFNFVISNIFTGVPFVLSIFAAIIMLIRSIKGHND